MKTREQVSKYKKLHVGMKLQQNNSTETAAEIIKFNKITDTWLVRIDDGYLEWLSSADISNLYYYIEN